MALIQFYIKNVGPAKIQRVQQKIPGCWTYVQQNENKFQKVSYLHIKFLWYRTMLNFYHPYFMPVSMVMPFWILSTCQKLPHTTVNIPTMPQRCFMLCTTYTNFWSIICPLEVRCLTLLSKIFQLLLLWWKLEYPEKSTDLSQVTDKLSTPRHEWGSNSQLKWW